MPFNSEGMKTIQMIDKWITFLGQSTGMVLASAIVMLYMFDDYGNDDDSEEFYYYPEKKEEQILLTIKEPSVDKHIKQIKNPGKKEDFLLEKADDTSIFAEIFPFGLLYELSNVP